MPSKSISTLANRGRHKYARFDHFIKKTWSSGRSVLREWNTTDTPLSSRQPFWTSSAVAARLGWNPVWERSVAVHLQALPVPATASVKALIGYVATHSHSHSKRSLMTRMRDLEKMRMRLMRKIWFIVKSNMTRPYKPACSLRSANTGKLVKPSLKLPGQCSIRPRPFSFLLNSGTNFPLHLGRQTHSQSSAGTLRLHLGP